MKEIKINPFKTLEIKKDWEDYVSYCDFYDCNVKDGVIFIIDYYAPEEILKKIVKFFEKIERNSDEFFYDSWENIRVDEEDNCAYAVPYYDSPNYIMCDYALIGKRRFDKEWTSFDDISDEFINNSEKALPRWFKIPEGWEECSCDYANGWYHRHDNPSEILEKMNEKGYDILFKISYQHMFECGFCIYYREREDN